MTFIQGKDLDYEDFKAKWLEYSEYLKSLKDKIPKSAYEFATADWHYDTADAKCPHDSWLEELKFNEVTEKDGKFEFKTAELYLKLLGAYHNGHLEIRYKNIKEYAFKGFKDFFAPQDLNGFIHHDWLRDEIRLSESGFVIHEIEWVNAHWIIECEDIESDWIPFDTNQTTDMSQLR